MLPFKEIKLAEQLYLREFATDTDSDELIWHRDKEDRLVQVVQSDDWWFQFDGQVPKLMKENLFIEANTWHRVIKGPNAKLPLVVKIFKYLKKNG